MKNILLILLFAFSTSLLAQTPILPLESSKGSQNTPNAYYKDINLILNQFKLYSIITISLIFSLVLLMIRIKVNHSLFYLFLIILLKNVLTPNPLLINL